MVSFVGAAPLAAFTGGRNRSLVLDTRHESCVFGRPSPGLDICDAADDVERQSSEDEGRRHLRADRRKARDARRGRRLPRQESRSVGTSAYCRRQLGSCRRSKSAVSLGADDRGRRWSCRVVVTLDETRPQQGGGGGVRRPWIWETEISADWTTSARQTWEPCARAGGEARHRGNPRLRERAETPIWLAGLSHRSWLRATWLCSSAFA